MLRKAAGLGGVRLRHKDPGTVSICAHTEGGAWSVSRQPTLRLRGTCERGKGQACSSHTHSHTACTQKPASPTRCHSTRTRLSVQLRVMGPTEPLLEDWDANLWWHVLGCS